MGQTGSIRRDTGLAWDLISLFVLPLAALDAFMWFASNVWCNVLETLPASTLSYCEGPGPTRLLLVGLLALALGAIGARRWGKAPLAAGSMVAVVVAVQPWFVF
jgi:hypothetical protein